MKDLHTTIGIFHNHDDVLHAVKMLKNNDYDTHRLSIIGQGEVVEDDIKVYSASTAMKTSTTFGGVLGSLLGVFTGMGLLAVPGMGVLFMAGALYGAVGGLSMGLIGGGLVGAFTAIGIGKEGVADYEKHLSMGKYLLLCHGTKEEVEEAEAIMKKETDAAHVKLHLNQEIVKA